MLVAVVVVFLTFHKTPVRGCVVRDVLKGNATIVGVGHGGPVDGAVGLRRELLADAQERPDAGREPHEVGERCCHVKELAPPRDEHDAVKALC